MKKRPYVIDFTKGIITLTKDFEEKANEPGTAEYGILKTLQQDFPNLRIIRKTHASTTSYLRPTYRKMETFIRRTTQGEDSIKTFQLVCENAKACPHAYQEVLNWFKENHPLYFAPPTLDGKGNLVESKNVVLFPLHPMNEEAVA